MNLKCSTAKYDENVILFNVKIIHRVYSLSNNI